MDILIGMHATYENVDSEAKDGDIVRFNAKATIDGEPFELWSRDNQATRLGVNNYGEAFDTIYLDLKKGIKKHLMLPILMILKHQDVCKNS